MSDVTESQIKIFRQLYSENKGTTMAVSSESTAHKNLRYSYISKILQDDDHFSVHDVGMGLADLGGFISSNYPEKTFTYSGSEILEEYVAEAKNRYPESQFFLRNIAKQSFEDRYDYLLLSGVFHQRRDSSIRDWENFYQSILKNSFAMCKKGIAFNFISPFVDFYQTHVYYCNLPKLLNFINDELSRFFVLWHNYALFEFTVYVYKSDFIRDMSPQPEFQKYF